MDGCTVMTRFGGVRVIEDDSDVTFEVTGVCMADGNRVQVKNEMGTWEDWKER